MKVSRVAIVYAIVSSAMMVLGMHCANMGFSAINEIVGTVIETFNMSRTIDSMTEAQKGGGISTLVFF